MNLIRRLFQTVSELKRYICSQYVEMEHTVAEQWWLDMARKASWANYRSELSWNESSWCADLEQLQILTTRSTNRDNLKLFRFLSSCYHFVSPNDRGKHSNTFYTRSIERRIKARTDRQETQSRTPNPTGFARFCDI